MNGEDLFLCCEGVSSWTVERPPLLARLFGRREYGIDISAGKDEAVTVSAISWKGTLFIVPSEEGKK